MSGGRFRRVRRSLAGVSPVRTPTVGTCARGVPSRSAACSMPASGARRFFSTSTASARSGEMYRTRVRAAALGRGLGAQPVERPQERGERLPGTRRGEDQRVLSLGDGLPAEALRARGLRERGGEPVADGRGERLQGHGATVPGSSDKGGPTVGCAHVAGRTHVRPPRRGRARAGRRPHGRAGRARPRADGEPATLRQPRRLARRARRRCAGAGRDLRDPYGAQRHCGGRGRGLPRARQHPRVRQRRRGRARRAYQRRRRLHHRQCRRVERAHPHHGRLLDRRRRPRGREGRRGGGREGGGPDPAERGLHAAGTARRPRHPRGRRRDRVLRPAARAPAAAVGAPRRGPGCHRRRARRRSPRSGGGCCSRSGCPSCAWP